MIQNTTSKSFLPSKSFWSQLFLIIVTISLSLSGVKVYQLWRSQSSESVVTEVAQASISEIKTVTALGYLEPKDEIIKLSTPSSLEGNRVDKLLVQEGDFVKKNQIIAILDNETTNKSELRKAQVEVKVAQARLEQVKAGAKQGEIKAQEAKFQQNKAELEGQIAVQRAAIGNLEAQLEGQKNTQQATIERIKAELTNAETECQRYLLLYQEGAVSASQKDNICLQSTVAQQQLKQEQATLNQIITTKNEQIKEAQANLKRTVATVERQIKETQATLNAVSEVRPVDVQILQVELESAKAAVEQAKANLELSYLRSPRDGQILKIHTWPGESVGDNGVVEIGQTNQMLAIAEIYQSDVSKIKVGQKVRVSSTSLTEELNGTVDAIGLQVERQNIVNVDPSANIDARVVKVRVLLDSESSQKVARLTNLQVKVVVLL